MSNTLAYLFVLLAIGIIFDFILWIFWVPFYFRFGLPLYIFRFPLSRRHLFWEFSQSLGTKSIPGSFYPTTIFKKISETELAFKNKPLEFKISLQLNMPYYGIVKLDPHSGMVTIKGYISWLTLFLMIWAFLFQKSFADQLDFINSSYDVFMLVLVFGFIIGMQVFVLRHLGKNIYKAFSSEST